MTEPELVMVIWKDAELKPGGWTDLADVDLTLPVMRSVGWLIGETEDAIGLASDICLDGNEVHGVGVIPKAWTNEVVRLGQVSTRNVPPVD